jgi:hypothetical protein
VTIDMPSMVKSQLLKIRNEFSGVQKEIHEIKLNVLKEIFLDGITTPKEKRLLKRRMRKLAKNKKKYKKYDKSNPEFNKLIKQLQELEKLKKDSKKIAKKVAKK